MSTHHTHCTFPALAFLVAIGFALGGGPAFAKAKRGDRDDDSDHRGDRRHARFCSATASAQFNACLNEVRDDVFTQQAICTNLDDEDEREECFDETREAQRDGNEECREQLEARREVCELLGEDRYEPSFDPADFDDDFTSPNPHFPLAVGQRWEYEGGEEAITVEVLDETKLIEGVTCIVVRDQVREDGELVENTDDWFGQRKDGTVDYCGEISQTLVTFEGDEPEKPELVSLEGSWKAGRDGDKPGTLFPGSPAVGQVHRQEWSPGNAEDVAQVLSTHYGFGGDPELDEHVPQALAELLCSNDCVVTGEFSALDPGGFERKYYASGVGLFLEVHPESGEIVQLVDCNVSPKCSVLPTP